MYVQRRREGELEEEKENDHFYSKLHLHSYVQKRPKAWPQSKSKQLLHMLDLWILLRSHLRITGLSHGRVPMQLHFWSCEQPVDLLEGEIAWFGVEEVDHRDEAEVEN